MPLTDRQAEDVEFLLNPDMWPCWPACPVCRDRAEEGNQNGCVVHGENIVYLLNVFDIKTGKEFESAQQYKYSGPIEMVQDGWYVD